MSDIDWDAIDICLWDGYANGPACGRPTGYTSRNPFEVNCLVCLRLRVDYLESELDNTRIELKLVRESLTAQ